MKTIITLLFVLFATSQAVAADLWVYKRISTAHYQGCTFTRDHYVGNLGQLWAFCPNPPVVTPRPAPIAMQQLAVPNSIVWHYYISYLTTVLDEGEGCYSPQGFQNANSVYFKEIDCTY